MNFCDYFSALLPMKTTFDTEYIFFFLFPFFSGFHHVLIYLIVSGLYGILVTLGNVFYSFQWDILLLETGVATAICVAPWLGLGLGYNDKGIGMWPIRLILFKLMFMSGVVKIQADCPTWNNLTALEYHFATQCLPGPLAWHMHQLPPFFLRLSVAATFVIEIPASFLLIAPSVTIRRFGVILQVLLQIMITMTGNYNFFNILTVVLCLSCWEDDNWAVVTSPSFLRIKLFNNLQRLVTCLFLYWSCKEMFQLEIIDSLWNIKLTFTKYDCEKVINYMIPLTILYLYVIFGVSAISTIWDHVRFRSGTFHVLGKSVRSIVCVIWIGLLAIPFLSLTNTLRREGFVGSKMFMPYYQELQSYHVSNGYGLFRSMTGVGSYKLNNEKIWGWAGQKPSIVSRPEIILEGIFEEEQSSYDDDDDVDDVNDNEKWQEINFRWKPGNVNAFPAQVAPHQPRLDWQMWFAALGTYQHNPWLIHLIYKLLEGCNPVLDLLSIEKDGVTREKLKFKKIRARLWHYDFTRIDTKWNRKIPNVTILNKRKKKNDMHNNYTESIQWWRNNAFTWPKQYWSRQFQKEYLPILEGHDPQLKEYLSAIGYMSTNNRGGNSNTCVYGIHRCEKLDNSSYSYIFCHYTEMTRAYNILFWFVSFCLVLKTISIFRNLIRKSHNKMKLD